MLIAERGAAVKGLVRAVTLLQKYRAGIVSLAFWSGNAWFSVHVSRRLGYSPKEMGAHWQWHAIIGDYPWNSILLTWCAFAIATAVIYYILRATYYKKTWLILYAVSLIVLYAVIVPTDSGGFDYALIVFPIFMLFLILLLGVWDFIASKIASGIKGLA